MRDVRESGETLAHKGFCHCPLPTSPNISLPQGPECYRMVRPYRFSGILSQRRKMKAREACAESPYQAAVRYTHDGKPMIFGQQQGRAFLQTSSETGRPVFQEVKRKYIENLLNHSDWKPWTGRLKTPRHSPRIKVGDTPRICWTCTGRRIHTRGADFRCTLQLRG